MCHGNDLSGVHASSLVNHEKDFMCFDNESSMPWGATRACALYFKEHGKDEERIANPPILLATRRDSLAEPCMGAPAGKGAIDAALARDTTTTMSLWARWHDLYKEWQQFNEKLGHGEDWDSWLKMEFSSKFLDKGHALYVIEANIKVTRRCRRCRKNVDPWQGGVAMNPSNPGDCLFDAFGYFLSEDLPACVLRRLCVQVLQEEDMQESLKEIARHERMSSFRYCSRVLRKMWGGKPELAILCRLAGCRAAVFDPWGLRYTVGEEGPFIHLGFYACHYVALKPDAQVVKRYMNEVYVTKHMYRGAGDRNRDRRRRSRSDRRSRSRRPRVTLTPAPERRASPVLDQRRTRQDSTQARARAYAEPDRELALVGEKKFIVKPVAGLSFEDERSWLELVTWEQDGVQGCDWRCLLCRKWATTAHRESSQHQRRVYATGRRLECPTSLRTLRTVQEADQVFRGGSRTNERSESPPQRLYPDRSRSRSPLRHREVTLVERRFDQVGEQMVINVIDGMPMGNLYWHLAQRLQREQRLVEIFEGEQHEALRNYDEIPRGILQYSVLEDANPREEPDSPWGHSSEDSLDLDRTPERMEEVPEENGTITWRRRYVGAFDFDFPQNRTNVLLWHDDGSVELMELLFQGEWQRIHRYLTHRARTDERLMQINRLNETVARWYGVRELWLAVAIPDPAGFYDPPEPQIEEEAQPQQDGAPDDARQDRGGVHHTNPPMATPPNPGDIDHSVRVLRASNDGIVREAGKLPRRNSSPSRESPPGDGDMSSRYLGMSPTLPFLGGGEVESLTLVGSRGPLFGRRRSACEVRAARPRRKLDGIEHKVRRTLNISYEEVGYAPSFSAQPLLHQAGLLINGRLAKWLSAPQTLSMMEVAVIAKQDLPILGDYEVWLNMENVELGTTWGHCNRLQFCRTVKLHRGGAASSVRSRLSRKIQRSEAAPRQFYNLFKFYGQLPLWSCKRYKVSRIKQQQR